MEQHGVVVFILLLVKLTEVSLNLLLRGILNSYERLQHSRNVYFRLANCVHDLLKASVVRHQLSVEHEADFVIPHSSCEVSNAVATVKQQAVADRAKVAQTGRAVLAESVPATEFAQIQERLIALLAYNSVLQQLLVKHRRLLPARVPEVELHFWHGIDAHCYSRNQLRGHLSPCPAPLIM